MKPVHETLEFALREENMRLHALVEKYERAMKRVVDALEEYPNDRWAMKLMHTLDEAMHGNGVF